MRMSKKLKYLLALHEITFLIIGLACFLVDFHIWRETGSFPPSGVGSPAFPTANCVGQQFQILIIRNISKRAYAAPKPVPGFAQDAFMILRKSFTGS